MSKLTKSEIKILRLLDKHVGSPFKDATVKFLRDTLAFTLHESLDWWKLWYINKEEEGGTPYEEMTDVQRGYSFLADTIKELISNKEKSPFEMEDSLSYEDVEKYKKMKGDYFESGHGNLEFGDDGLTLELPREEWETWFSGMGDDDIWRYNAARMYQHGHDEENLEAEEMDYISPDESAYQTLNKLGEVVGDNRKWSTGGRRAEEGEITEWLYRNLHREDAENIIDQYVWTLGSEVSRSRNTELLKWYDETVEYPETDCGGYSDQKCITIPYEDLLVMIKENEWVSLSELKDAELNSELGGVGDWYYDTWLDEEGYEEVMDRFKEEIEDMTKRVEDEEDYLTIIEKKKEFMDLLSKLKFSMGSYDWRCKDNRMSSQDGKLTVCPRDLDIENNRIKFIYNGEAHLTPIEEFIHWAQGSVLDLNENVRIGKYRLIMETISPAEEITKIAIFDFDGTLMDTPHPEEGKREWEEKTGKPYPHIGWWSKRESLDNKVFNIKPIASTILDYTVESDDPHTLMIMLTGRLPQQADQVEEILNGYNILFDEYHYKDEGDTLKSKLNTIQSLLHRYPNVKFIEMYEDRVPHAIAFEEWGKENNVNIKVNVVTDAQEAFK